MASLAGYNLSMTAVTLYDAMAEARHRRAGANPRNDGLAPLVEKLVAESLADIARLDEYQTLCGQHDWQEAAVHDALTRSLYDLFKNWAAEASQVLERADRIRAVGVPVARLRELNEAYGRVVARLTLTPDMIARAMDQVRRGEAIPAKELRDDLRARLRA